jgi:hypothetical protein
VINYRSADIFFKYFNEREENKVLGNLLIFREFEKNLKMTLVLSFFVMLVSRGQKRDKLSLERCPFKPFNEWKRKQAHLVIFSCLESLKRA